MISGRPREVVGALLTIGDEILLGDIPNGNAHHIAAELRARGFRLSKIMTLGDGEEAIIRSLGECTEGSDFVIVTGGLGPTDDDRTCAAVSRAFHRPLVVDVGYTQWLTERMTQYGLPWNDHVARMGQLPTGAVKIGRDMAGFFIEHRDRPWYFLPGVPHEMRILLAEVVIPGLEDRFPDRPTYVKHILRVQDLTESQVNQRLHDLPSQALGVELGYLPQLAENWITLFAAGEDEAGARRTIDKAVQEIIPRIGSEYISGQNDDCLEKVIGRQLRLRNWTLAVAESCTGGLVSRKITAIAGASDYLDRAFITYSNRAKSELLKVPEELLRQHGAVSEPVARSMAVGARTESRADVSLAITGIAGPGGGSREKPVGTVFVGCATLQRTVVKKHLFDGTREHIQEMAALAALVLLWRTLSHDPNVHSH